MKQDIVPVFIIGAARNGTTNLENAIASFPQVAGVEHWLHYGSHESNLYRNKKYWGDLTDAYSYIRFLHQYSASDYFKLCGGDIEYHLNHKRNDFYEFFLDLMDRYAGIQKKVYWITKLDPNFCFDDKENQLFFSLLEKRYASVKFIRIKRNFEDAFKSYLNMEGKNYSTRQRPVLQLPALILQASRHTLTYGKITKHYEHHILEIDFEAYIKNQEACIQDIADYLKIGAGNLAQLRLNRYKVNTSFVNKSKKELPDYIAFLLSFVQRIFKRYPIIPKIIWKSYNRYKGNKNPIFHRILCYEHFKEDLLKELARNNAVGLLKKIQEEK